MDESYSNLSAVGDRDVSKLSADADSLSIDFLTSNPIQKSASYFLGPVTDPSQGPTALIYIV